MIEIWDKEGSGVLLEEPLLLRANRAGRYGENTVYPGGSVSHALFTYLCGVPDEKLITDRPELFHSGWLVCMSREWESVIRRIPLRSVMRRFMMRPMCRASDKKTAALPDGCTLRPFTEEIFNTHPYGHGSNYRDFTDFQQNGSGAVVLYENRVVSSASSFLTFENEVELDVSTDPEFRGKGLADNCVGMMLKDCAERGLTVHWDAQNIPSMNMAKSHGFCLEQDFAVYDPE